MVLFIITILLALTSGAVLEAHRHSAGRANTITGLGMMDAKAKTQWQNVSEKAFSDNSQQASSYIQNWSNTNPGQLPTAARTAYVQAMLVQAFPVSFKEALTPDSTGVIQPWPAYQTFLNKQGITAANVTATPGPNEASVCLLMALTIGPYNTGVSSDSFGSANVNVVPLSTGGTAKAVVDGFGTPVAVSRGATGLVIQSAGQDRVMGNQDDLFSNKLPQ